MTEQLLEKTRRESVVYNTYTSDASCTVTLLKIPVPGYENNYLFIVRTLTILFEEGVTDHYVLGEGSGSVSETTRFIEQALDFMDGFLTDVDGGFATDIDTIIARIDERSSPVDVPTDWRKEPVENDA